MANKYYWPVLQGDNALGRRYIVSQRGERILHSDHIKAFRLQERITLDQHDPSAQAP